jgi:glycosyltransferase involved in cell wall biosynthesis
VESQRKIRLLIILEGETISGPAKNVLQFCREVRNLSGPSPLEVAIATFVRRSGTQDKAVRNQLQETAAASSAQVYSIDERFVFDPQAITGLRKLVKQINPDIVQTHHVKSHFLVRLSGVWKTHAWVAFHHGYTKESTRMQLYDQLDRWSLRAAPRIVTVCEPFKKQICARLARSRVSVLHNAISFDSSNDNTQLNKSEAGRQNQPTILAVGRLSAEKAFSDLIFAIDELRRLRPDLAVQLVILGEGPERGQIERTIRERKLQDRVVLRGHVADVRPYYRSADILAISSVSEGSPNALLEAMAAGLPVVATSVGGIPEIATHRETALLVPPRAPAAMASALNLLLTNSDLSQQLARNARALIEKRYSSKSRARKLLDFYDEVCREQLADDQSSPRPVLPRGLNSPTTSARAPEVEARGKQ